MDFQYVLVYLTVLEKLVEMIGAEEVVELAVQTNRV
jgi:hypothetical protein